MEHKPRIIFMGTSPFAVPILEHLNRLYTVLLVVTTPDKPAGRKQLLKPSPVKLKAQSLNLPIAEPERLKNNTEFLEQLQTARPDLIIVASYGKILPKTVLEVPALGCINVHPSLLPRYRGATPLQSALLHGDEITGTTIMLMDEGMDTGPILQQETLTLPQSMDFATLEQTLAHQSATLLEHVIPAYIAGTLVPQPQSTDGVIMATTITPESGHINWNSPAQTIHNQIRALSSTEGTYTTWKGIRCNIHRAESCPEPEKHAALAAGTVEQHLGTKNVCVRCSEGFLTILEIQLAGKKRMSMKDFLNGQPTFIGSQLS